MRRIPQLDGIRALAILMVFLHHALNVELMIDIHGLWAGVDIFFVLSGFLITGILVDAKSGTPWKYFAHFYARRARRLLAPYALLLIVASLVFGLGWAHYWYYYFFLTNVLFAFDIPHPRCFDPLWSLAVEEQFYLVWPVVVYLLTPRRLGQLSLALIVIAPVLRALAHFSDQLPVYTLAPFRMDLLAAGALIAIAWRSRRDLIERWGTLIGGAATIVGSLGLFVLSHFGIGTYTNSALSNVVIFECTLLIGAGILLFALAGRGVGWMRVKPMVYIGTISYSMYLIHMLILDLPFVDKLPSSTIPIVAFVLTVLYAALSWSLIESRLLGRPRTIDLDPRPLQPESSSGAQ